MSVREKENRGILSVLGYRTDYHCLGKVDVRFSLVLSPLRFECFSRKIVL